MVGPVRHGGAFVRVAGQFARHQIAERQARHVDILIAALQEIHRHVERVIGVTLEAHAVLERERQHAGAVLVGVGPDLRAERQEAVGLALGERRIGEQRGADRLQRERDAQLLHHVGFGGEVVVGLDRAGPVHHVEAERADLRHILGHDAIAALGHARHVGPRPFRRHADAEEADAERRRDLAHLREMRHQFAVGLMHTVERRAG